MDILKYKNYDALSEAVALQMVNQIISKPDTVFCLASGNTPLKAYEYFVEKVKKETIDYSRCVFFGLDEWIGISPDDTGSCHYFLTKNVFEPLGIANENIYLFDGLSKNPEAECDRISRAIEKNGIDLIVVGIGMNGHIGFNEPGSLIGNKVQIVALDRVTQTVGQKYFDKPMLLKKGITIALRSFLDAKKALLIANGAQKASIIQQTIEGEVNITIPSTIIQLHKNASVMIDDEAAACLIN